MSTRRAVHLDLNEIENLKNGDAGSAIRAAREAQHEKAQAAEREALGLFFARHPEVANCDANTGLLLNEARSYGAAITAQLLEVAMLRVAPALAAAPPPPVPELSPQEVAAAERSRLLGLSLPELHAEIRRNNLQKRIPADSLSPEVAKLKTRADVRRLSGSVLRGMLYRLDDGSARRLNTAYINKILQGNI